MSGWRDVLSGEAVGVGPGLMRTGLAVASLGYGLGTRIRNWSYDVGWARQTQAAVPVVSVGNVTAGGTGKTPLCAWVARWFRRHDLRVCLVSRGYGSVDGAPNDEALVLEQLCPDVPHLQGPDRASLATIAVNELDSQVILLDDAFQHRQLRRDVDLVLVDATNPWGYGHLLPRGLMREPRSALRRAQAVIVTRVDAVSEDRRSNLLEETAKAAPGIPVLEAVFAPETLVSGQGQTAAVEILKGQRVAAFCGLGNPAAFRKTLESCEVTIAGWREFPDHHPYSREDVDSLRRWAVDAKVDAVVTSQKDLVKIGLSQLGPPLWAIQIEARFLTNQNAIERLLQCVADRVPRSEAHSLEEDER